MIELGHNVVISEDVRFLTHDYSITRAFLALGMELDAEVYNVRGISVGDNTFIGLGSILVPGCRIGRNVIVGAGSVLRGDVPDNSLVMGNPAQVIGDTLAWGGARRKLLESGLLKRDPSWWGRLEGDARLASLPAAEAPLRGDPDRIPPS